MHANRNRIVLMAELLDISISAADALLASCLSSVSLCAFSRGLADGAFRHPVANHLVRARLKAMFVLQTLMSEECLSAQKERIDARSLEQHLVELLDGRVRETFVAVFLDGQYQLIASEILFMGSIDSACVYHRVVMMSALSHHTSSIIVAHNHPSGSRVPSQADIDMTRRLARCLNIVDIELVDHVIVAAGRCESLRNLGFV
jgi:DNA repair protein RadC